MSNNGGCSFELREQIIITFILLLIIIFYVFKKITVYPGFFSRVTKSRKWIKYVTFFKLRQPFLAI